MARMFQWNTYGAAAMSVGGSTAPFQVSVGDANFISDYETVAADRKAASAIYGGPYTYFAFNSQVAINRSGEFVITWVANQDNDVVTTDDQVDSDGIYYRVFDADGTAQTAVDCQANHVVTALDTTQFYSTAESALYWDAQLNPSVGIDADGDFTITWDGNGTDGSTGTNDTTGVFVRSFHATRDGYTSSPAVTPEYMINTTTKGSQAYSSVAMDASGDYVVVWSGSSATDPTGIYSKFHHEPTDTAGPIVTGFQLPDGTQVSITNGVTVSSPVKAVVITFDEALNAATATAIGNYSVLLDGVVNVGVISTIYYGLDEVAALSSNTNYSTYGFSSATTYKYQVVLILNSALGNGDYQIVVTNKIKDAAGNALNLTGNAQNGSIVSGTIYVTTAVSGSDTKVSTQSSSSSSSTSTMTTNATASDAKGDYVVVWTDTATATAGIWAEIYTQTSTLNADRTRSTSVMATKIIHVTTDVTASDAAVAVDTFGDFVVTWSAYNSTTDWDVYAQTFNTAGTATSSAFMVNSYTIDAQRYSSVAMDAEGNFVVTWQSRNQDGSGYGIYAKRYSVAAQPIDGADSVQSITFDSDFTGTFALRWDNDSNVATPDLITSAITYSGSVDSSLAAAVQAALMAIGANVTVTVGGSNTLLVTFIGTNGNKVEPMLWVSAVRHHGDHRHSRHRRCDGVCHRRRVRRVPRQRHHGRQSNVPRCRHERQRLIRHHLDFLRPSRRQCNGRQHLRQTISSLQ